MKKSISGIVFSDVHLGLARNPTKDIIANLKREIYKHKSIDIAVIAGDLYERILAFSSEDALLSVEFMLWLYNFCNTNNIILRILEGTPSHDFNQARIFDVIYDKHNVNYRYVDDIEVEYIEELDINVLYVPDEARPSIPETMVDIYKVIDGKEIDIAIMHGHFEYQLPITLDSSFKESDFEFVKYFIFIGHIHNHNPRGKILPPGSFDRLSFGEEEAKGYIYFKIHPVTGASFIFIENTGAKRFDTLKIKKDCINHATAVMLKKLNNYPSNYLRLEIPHSFTLDTTILSDIARKKQVSLTIKSKIPKKLEDESNIMPVIKNQFTITPDNIKTLLTDKIDIDDELLHVYETEISAIIGAVQ